MTRPGELPGWSWPVGLSVVVHVALALAPVPDAGPAARAPTPVRVGHDRLAAAPSAPEPPATPAPTMSAVEPSPAPEGPSRPGPSPVEVREDPGPPPVSSRPVDPAYDGPISRVTGQDLPLEGRAGGLPVRAGNTREEGFELGDRDPSTVRGYLGGVPGGRGGGDGAGTADGSPPPAPPSAEPDTPARLTQVVEPDYPRSLVEVGLEGQVLLAIDVDARGRPAAISVARSLHPRLDELAVAAAETWRWRPARTAGRPVPSTVRVGVTFRVEEGR